MQHDKPVVSFITRILTHYRIPFHERVRSLLAERGVIYRLIYGQPDAEEAVKGDLASLPWAEAVANRAIFGRGKLVWQPVLKRTIASDLLVLGQENQLLLNYPLQLMPAEFRPKIALWGHGRNFQSRNPDGPAERWKRYWAMRCDWWFGYTEASKTYIVSQGFPEDRFTVFNNAVDTTELANCTNTITSAEIMAVKASFGIAGDNVAIFVGGLYSDKRLDFLIEASDRVRACLPDFTLIVVGGGVDRSEIDAAATTRPWLIAAGPRFGREKAALMLASQLFLMPGLVGLAVLDAAAVGLPIITTAYPYHSPEIAYLDDRKTGLIVTDWQDASAYADAVVVLMRDVDQRERMAAAARDVARHYTIEGMAVRFCNGVIRALEAPRL